MNIYDCLLYGTLPEDIISKNVVDFVESKILSNEAFKLKSVPEGSNPSKTLEGVIGYCTNNSLAYLSKTSEIKSLIGIDPEHKRLIYDPNGFNFNEERDSYVFTVPGNIYVREGFNEILEDFVKSNYRIFLFDPQNSGRDSLGQPIKDLSNIVISKELNIEHLRN
jgi:hypothetical protein